LFQVCVPLPAEHYAHTSREARKHLVKILRMWLGFGFTFKRLRFVLFVASW
jgi:hypothetical protein